MVRVRKLLLTMVALMVASFGLHPATAFPPSGPPVFDGGPTDFFSVSDGTSIALNVVNKGGCNETNTCPAILEMAGYENGSSSASGRTTLGQLEDWCKTEMHEDCGGFPLTGDSHAGTTAYRFDENYVVVHASVRGTGCSAGEFDLFSSRSSLDGVEIIENYIAKAGWSNGKVGIIGHSYSGLTGTLVAAQYGLAVAEGHITQPHLVAMSVSGLIDDLYRGITYPGGVSNSGFPPLWTLGVRPAYDVLGGQFQGIFRNADDHPDIAQKCAENIATHRRTVTNDPVVHGALTDTDSDWWRARSLISVVHNINVPILITGAYQDEQTGPRGPAHLWEAVKGVPKRLILTNGDHGTNVNDVISVDRVHWIDHWAGLGDYEHGTLTEKKTSVRVYFETRGGSHSGYKDGTTFPLGDTTWTPYFFDGGETLSTSVGSGGPDPYSTGIGRQSWFWEFGPTAGKEFTTPKGPDELDYRINIAPSNGPPVAIAGPITANLFIASTAPDTELFVQVIDEDPVAKTWTYLQRGLLRASHNAVSDTYSDYDTKLDPFEPTKDGEPNYFMYRPFRPHSNAVNITPTVVNEYLVEIFPVGHIFRPGHNLLVKIMSPPRTDSYYAYVPKYAPGINFLHHDAAYPSRITLPIVPLPDGVPSGETAPACGEQEAVRCVTY